MKFIKYTPYLYLAAGIFFAVDAYIKFIDGDDSYWFGLLLFAVCIFMFFFRLRYIKKFENYRNNRR